MSHLHRKASTPALEIDYASYVLCRVARSRGRIVALNRLLIYAGAMSLLSMSRLTARFTSCHARPSICSALVDALICRFIIREALAGMQTAASYRPQGPVVRHRRKDSY